MSKIAQRNWAPNGLTSSGHPRRRRGALELLLRERRRLREESLAARGGGPDPLEMAQGLEEEQVWLAVLDRSCDARMQMQEALALLTEGRYGRCVDCGKAIPDARLQALPFALRCVTCQEQRETQQAPPASLPWVGLDQSR